MGASWAQVYSFGCNDEGALGRDTSVEGSEMVPGKVELQEKVVQVSAGDSHTAALTEDGRVFLWGSFRVRWSEKLHGGWQTELTGGAPRITHLHALLYLLVGKSSPRDRAWAQTQFSGFFIQACPHHWLFRRI